MIESATTISVDEHENNHQAKSSSSGKIKNHIHTNNSKYINNNNSSNDHNSESNRNTNGNGTHANVDAIDSPDIEPGPELTSASSAATFRLQQQPVRQQRHSRAPVNGTRQPSDLSMTTSASRHHPRSVSAHRSSENSGRATLTSVGVGGAKVNHHRTLATSSHSNSKSSHHLNGHGYGGADDDDDANATATAIEDLYVVLAKKENELQLAAEFGKALLERNEELSKANERITEEYSHRLEQLEQEKHELRRKLDALDGEYDNKLGELQADYAILEKKYREQQELLKRAERDKSRFVEELAEQNKRLTNELHQATEHEELLGKQLEQLKEKLTLRTSNGNDHIVQLEAFRHEVDVLTKRKQDLERRLNSIHSERDHLNMSLEESGDKIQLLEQCINDRDARILDMQRELDEMRHANQWLNKRLDNTDNTTTTTTTTTSSTSGTFNGHVQRSSLVRKHSHNNDNSLLQQQQQQQQSNNFAKRRCEIVNVEPTSLYDEIEMCSSSSLSPRGTHLSAAYQQANNASASDAAVCQSITSHEIVVEIYSLLRQFYIELQQRKDTFVNQQQQHGNSHNHHHNNANTNHHNSSNNSSTTDDSGISDLNAIDAKEAVKLMYDTQHWCKLLANIKALLDDMPCSTCQLMIVERHDYEVLQKQHAKLADELKVKNQQLLELTSSTSTQACELDALREQCQLLRHDLETCDMPKEEIVQMAWRTRDEAVRRKNTAEIALAKTRIENMQVSSQLMEVVMQKSELSERIAQFEDDMHYMMQDSVHMKFTWQEYAEQLRRAKQQQASSDSSGRRSGAVGRSSSSSIGATSAIDWPQQLLMKTIGNGPRFNFWSSSKSSSPAKEAPAATASSTQSNSTTTSSTVESKSATATDAKDVPAQHPTINSATTPSPATTKT